MDEIDHSIESVVIHVVREIVGKSRLVRLSDTFINDLHISSDDLSMYFAPQVERRLNVKVPLAEWRNVTTLADACAVLGKYQSY